jgi:hypothetical protein
MEQNPKEQNPKKTIGDFFNEPWKLVSALATIALIGGVAVSAGYVGWRCGSLTECVLVRKESIPKSLSLSGIWFYETKTSDAVFQYRERKCTAILGKAEIFQSEVSNEFRINAVRYLCVLPASNTENRSNSNNSPTEITTNVGWSSNNASVLPDSRRVNIALITRDPSPRFGYIEGSIPEHIKGDSPTEFRGDMYYLNTNNQTYNIATISFCKEGTECAKEISQRFK